MEQKELKSLLQQVADGSLSVEQAMLRIKLSPYTDIGFAKLDDHRAVRQGIAEVIYGAGKTPEQIRDIAAVLLDRGQKLVLITRMSEEAAELTGKTLPLQTP